MGSSIEGHCTTNLPKVWSDALTEFTVNQIPIHLIDLDTLRLVSRSDVARYYRPVLAAHLDTHPSSQNPSQLEVARTIFKLVKYAIFSHRWREEGEPTFQDMPMVRTFADALVQDDETVLAHTLAAHVQDTPTRAGLHKLLQFCAKARAYHCRFAWSDTCCIHKASSAELDESIRAMFRWYHNARICIVHLDASHVLADIPADPWFTRGWTLQELLAPPNLKFYNHAWRPFSEDRNDKDRRNGWVPDGAAQSPVWRAIRTATRIPSSQLNNFSPGAFDVAQRLSWAANRRTTRVEDMAYALVGIFGIHMPVQYGEGRFAFQRLMEALLLRVRGYEVFMWTGPSSQYSAALPASIQGYLAVREAHDSASVRNSFGDPALAFTHKGLQVEVLLVHMQCEEADDDLSESETSSDQDAQEHVDSEAAADERSDNGARITNSQSPHARPRNDPEDDGLNVRFLENDEEYQPMSEGRCSWFHFTDPDRIFKPLSVWGRGPCIMDTLTAQSSDMPQYAMAILDYHRDWERGPGCVYLPYDIKPKYLAFVLYRDDPADVWEKLQTDALVYLEVEAGRVYEGQTVSVCL